MKKILSLAVGLVLVMALVGCNNTEPETPNTLSPAIMHDNNIYIATVDQVPVTIDESEYIGEVDSEVPISQWPTENGQANHSLYMGLTYASYEDDIVVLIENEWVIFKLKDSGTPPEPSSTGKSKPITLEDYENIEKGTTAEEIREKFGEPEFTTSGVWVEIYHHEDKSISFSYETNVEHYGTITGVYIETIGEDKEVVQFGDLRPMIMVDDQLYFSTGELEPFTSVTVFDNEIVSTVDQSEKPTENGQSNFGCVGCPYTYSIDEKYVIVVMDDGEKWARFELSED